jgi:hypothetical protein
MARRPGIHRDAYVAVRMTSAERLGLERLAQRADVTYSEAVRRILANAVAALPARRRRRTRSAA